MSIRNLVLDLDRGCSQGGVTISSVLETYTLEEDGKPRLTGMRGKICDCIAFLFRRNDPCKLLLIDCKGDSFGDSDFSKGIEQIQNTLRELSRLASVCEKKVRCSGILQTNGRVPHRLQSLLRPKLESCSCGNNHRYKVRISVCNPSDIPRSC